MKKLTGYFVAAGALLLTLAATAFAKRFGTLLDSFYPYLTRMLQNVLAHVSGIFPFTVWQVLVVLLALLLIGTLIWVVARKRSFIRWLGWVLAIASLVWMTHTTIYGLNFYTSALSDSLRMENSDISQEDLENALIYFRDKANELAAGLPRDENGDLIFDDFDTLADTAAGGYENLKAAGYSVFSGSTVPVKKLAWAKIYNAMGICGVSIAVTGEAAVVADTPCMALPFVMCHEMAHIMCITQEDDANFAAFLACQANDDLQFQYSAYYMAYRYCRTALYKVDSAAASTIHQGVNEEFSHDLKAYNDFYNKNQSTTATNIANAANEAYIQVSGDSNGTASYGMVATQLTNWYLQNGVQGEQSTDFDPFDADYINRLMGENG